jgi:MarR family 2-MHQ and catechol resistance regulon transcriptional repressor
MLGGNSAYRRGIQRSLHPSCTSRSPTYLDIKIFDAKIYRVTRRLSADTSGTHVWLVLMKAHRTLARHAARSIQELQMCFSDFAILELLLHRGPQPVNAIGKRIDLTSGSITTAVDRLEERGLVARGFDPDDRRARIVSLTAEGKASITAAFAHHKRAMDQAANGLTRDERETLISLIKRLGTSAEQQLESISESEDPHE